MNLREAVTRLVIAVTARGVPTWRQFRAWFSSTPDPRALQVEEQVQNLSDDARIVLWHLCVTALMPQTIAERLNKAGRTTEVDKVISELEDAGLVEHDFAGNRALKADVRSIVCRLLHGAGRESA